MKILEGFAGSRDGSFFRSPAWIDLKKPPGYTPEVPPAWKAWGFGLLKLMHVFYSPNFWWLSIALAMYFFAPYDFEAAKTWSVDWVVARFVLNSFVTLSYFGFWEVTLYVARWSKRKFKPTSWPTTTDVLHNMSYTMLGVMNWTAWEVLFLHLYATGKLPYIADHEALVSPGNIARTLLWTALIPVLRSFHFYFAHRFLHMNALYKFVHSLHHRNVDIEPFAGLCMHPIEHLYYFSCVFPSLSFMMSPFHLLWNGVHLLLSPAASHSGWEDHTQSDQFHYIHHAKFECNYGSGSFNLDSLFGTFREKLGASKV